MNDTIHLGESKPWRVIPTLDELLPGGFKILAMATPRAEEFDEPGGVVCQRPGLQRCITKWLEV